MEGSYIEYSERKFLNIISDITLKTNPLRSDRKDSSQILGSGTDMKLCDTLNPGCPFIGAKILHDRLKGGQEGDVT